MGGVSGVMDPRRCSSNLKTVSVNRQSRAFGSLCLAPYHVPPWLIINSNAEAGSSELVNVNSTEPQSPQQSRIGSSIASPERRWSEGMGGSQAEPPVQLVNRGTPTPLLWRLRLPAALI